MKTIDLKGVGEAYRQLQRETPLSKEEATAGGFSYEWVCEGTSRNRTPNWTYNVTVHAFPSAEDMQEELQRLNPTATVLVDEDQEQDFEFFVESNYGITDPALYR